MKDGTSPWLQSVLWPAPSDLVKDGNSSGVEFELSRENEPFDLSELEFGENERPNSVQRIVKHTEASLTDLLSEGARRTDHEMEVVVRSFQVRGESRKIARC